MCGRRLTTGMPPGDAWPTPAGQPRRENRKFGHPLGGADEIRLPPKAHAARGLRGAGEPRRASVCRGQGELEAPPLLGRERTRGRLREVALGPDDELHPGQPRQPAGPGDGERANEQLPRLNWEESLSRVLHRARLSDAPSAIQRPALLPHGSRVRVRLASHARACRLAGSVLSLSRTRPR